MNVFSKWLLICVLVFATITGSVTAGYLISNNASTTVQQELQEEINSLKEENEDLNNQLANSGSGDVIGDSDDDNVPVATSYVDLSSCEVYGNMETLTFGDGNYIFCSDNGKAYFVDVFNDDVSLIAENDSCGIGSQTLYNGDVIFAFYGTSNLYCYSFENKNITLISTELGYYPMCKKLSDNNYFIYQGNDVVGVFEGLYLLNTVDYSVTKFYDDVSSYTALITEDSGNMLMKLSKTDGSNLIVYFDIENYTFTEYFNEYDSLSYVTKCNNLYVFNYTADSNYGFFVYDFYNLDYVYKNYDAEFDFNEFTYVPKINKLFITSSVSLGHTYAFLFSFDDLSLTQVNADFVVAGYDVVTGLSNGNLLLTSCSSSYLGIILFNADDNTFTQIYDAGYYWIYYSNLGTFANYVDCFFELSNGDCLISGHSNNSVCLGLLYYNSTDNTVTEICSKGYRWTYAGPYLLTDGNFLIRGYVGTGVLNINDISFTYVGGQYTYSDLLILQNGDLILSYNTYYHYYFDIETYTLKALSGWSSSYNLGAYIVVELSDGNIIFSFANINGIYLFNATDFTQSTLSYFGCDYELIDNNDGTVTLDNDSYTFVIDLETGVLSLKYYKVA